MYRYPLRGLLVFIVVVLFSCPVAGVVMPVDTYRLSLERNGTPYEVFADFSAVCYGHSFIAVAWDSHYLNTTAENPVPLNRVLDLQVQCNPSDQCTAQTYGEGDPERSEWCELNGTTTGGDTIRATITAKNLEVTCTGGEELIRYRRCSAEARAKNPCDQLFGSEQLRCMDSQKESVETCRSAFSESIDRSSPFTKWCEIRFNLPASGPAEPGAVRSADTRGFRFASILSGKTFNSLSFTIRQRFGGRCE